MASSETLLKSCRFEFFLKAETSHYILPIRDLGFNISIDGKKDYFSCELSHPSYETINRFLDLIDGRTRKPSLSEDETSGTLSNLGPRQYVNVLRNKAKCFQGVDKSRNSKSKTGDEDGDECDTQEGDSDDSTDYSIFHDESFKIHINQMNVKQKPDNNTDFRLDPNLSTKVQLNRDGCFKRTFRPEENGSMARESSATKMEKEVCCVDNTGKKDGGGCKTQQEIDDYQGLPILRIGTQVDCASVRPRPQTATQNSAKNVKVDQSHIGENSFGKSVWEKPKTLMLIFTAVEYELALEYLAQSDSMKYLKEAQVLNSGVVIDVEGDKCCQELLHFKAGLNQDGIFLDQYDCVKQVQEYWGKKIIVESCDDQFLLTAPRDVHTEIKKMFPYFFKSEIVPLLSNGMNQNLIEGVENASSLDADRIENDGSRASRHVEAIPNENGQSSRNDSYEVHHPTIIIKVHKANIAELSVDVIVTAANDELKQMDDVGKAIAEAAGKSMTDECKSYIAQNSKIDVPHHFVSCPGNIYVKQIYHACMPDKSHYIYKSNEYKRDLRQSTLWCLMHAEHQGHNSIAFPITIGDSVFSRISTTILAESYMKAVRHFEKLRGRSYLRQLQEIHFVDIDVKMVHGVKRYFIMNGEETLTATCPDFKEDEQMINTYLRKLRTGSLKLMSTSVITSDHSAQSANNPNRRIRLKPNVADQPTQSANSSNGSRPKTTIADQPVGSANGGARPKTTVAGSSFQVREECVICMNNRDDILKLSCCQSDICIVCDKRCEKCPFCRASQRTLIGHMPPGTMSILLKKYCQLPGSGGRGSYEITYYILAWSPKQYTAHIPTTFEGLKVLLLYIIAFHRRLTFTRGLVEAIEKEDRYKWKILHKTSLKAGDQEKEGFIFQDAFDCQHFHSLLNSRRVTLDNVNTEEQRLIDNCQKELLSCGFVMIGDNS